MVWIGRETVEANISAIVAELDLPLGRAMAKTAQALQLTNTECGSITTMRWEARRPIPPTFCLRPACDSCFCPGSARRPPSDEVKEGRPSPAHFLQLAGQLGLSADQKARMQSLFDSMKAEAVSLGEKLLEQEATLDYLFASPSITADSLKTITAKIGVTQAALRDTHLKYHLQTAQVLTLEASCCHNDVLQQRYSGGRSCGKIQLPECSFAG
jgi:Spy/CpxP family protein refolding chaperone